MNRTLPDIAYQALEKMKSQRPYTQLQTEKSKAKPSNTCTLLDHWINAIGRKLLGSDDHTLATIDAKWLENQFNG